MNLDKLEVGKVFKNYKELCEELEMEEKKANSKKAQMKELQRHCRLIQSGHSFTIMEIYDNPLRKIDGRGKDSIYGDLIQTLITDYLIESGKKTNYITRNNLLRHLKMINENYNYCSNNVPYLSKYADIDEQIVYDFFNTSDSNFRAAIETALDNLRDKAIAISEKVTMICDKNNTHRAASEEDKEKILRCEKIVLNELNFEEITHARISNRWNEFKKRLSEVLEEKTNIAYYYISYQITINEKHISEEHSDSINKILNFFNSEDKKDELNTLICERLIQNAIKRKTLISSNEKISKARSKFSYVNDNEKLVKLLIHKDAEDIKDDINELKREEIDKWHEEWGFLENLN